MDHARRRFARTLAELGGELRAARMSANLTQSEVGRAIGTSAARICGIEHGRVHTIKLWQVTAHGAAVGLRLVTKTYPTGAPIRDAGQVKYVERFLARIAPSWARQLEVPIPLPGDLRAVDVVLRSAECMIAVEIITRLTDVQAQLRSALEKARDIGANRLIVVLAATHANRRALDAARGVLPGTFTLDTRRVLADLAAGRDPRTNAVILIS